MTDYSDVPTIYTGDWIDAAWLNQYVGDNFRALKQGFANAGDVAYALDSNTLAALAKPSVKSFFRMQSTGVPEYVPSSAMPGAYHVMGSNFSDTLIDTNSTSYVYTGIAFNFILEKECTIWALAVGLAGKDNGSADGHVAISIDGTINPNEATPVRAVGSNLFIATYIKTAVPAGARNVSLYYRTESGSDAMGITSAQLYAMAFVSPGS